MKRAAASAPISSRHVHACFQPMIDPANGSIRAVEARVRLDVPGAGIIAGSEALGWARKIRQMPNLDCFMIAEAAKGLHQLESSMVPYLAIAINISSETLSDVDGRKAFDRVLGSSSLPPGVLRVELPAETAMTEDIQKHLREWRHAGFNLVLDHVEQTGQVELAKELKCGVKLSASLFSAASRFKAASNKIETLVNDATSAGLHVGAEGIVQMEQLGLLAALGCNEVQGDLISRPREMSDLMFLLKRGSCW